MPWCILITELAQEYVNNGFSHCNSLSKEQIWPLMVDNICRVYIIGSDDYTNLL